jgi:hypothetical protein
MSWRQKLLGLGTTTSNILEVGSTHAATRIQHRPFDWRAARAMGGQFRMTASTGNLTALSNAPVFSARWGSTTAEAAITDFTAEFQPFTPFTAGTLSTATSASIWMFRDVTATPTGGTVITPVGQRQRLSRLNNTSQFSDVRISLTVVLNIIGTLDANPIGGEVFRRPSRINPAAGTEEIILPSALEVNYSCNIRAGEHPIVLTTNDTISLRVNNAAWPVAGNGFYRVSMAWVEYPVGGMS